MATLNNRLIQVIFRKRIKTTLYSDYILLFSVRRKEYFSVKNDQYKAWLILIPMTVQFNKFSFDNFFVIHGPAILR